MKKIFFGMMAAAAVLATSCAKELQSAEGDATVTFAVGTPEIATRAYSDGTTATELQYAVYDVNGNLLEDLTGTQEINISTTVELKLTTGNTYTVAFWADSQAAPYTVDFANKSVSVDYTGVKSNDENLDAFYAWYTFTVTGAQTETVEIKRPFAQLNVGTADLDASESAGYVPTISTVTVSNVYSTLNFATGAVDGATAITFAENAIPAGEEFPVAGYEYLAMNYLLVAADKALVEVEFTYTDGSNAKTRTVGSVPVQRNYRTNIYGNILTSDVDLNVVIKPEYNEPAHELDALQKAALNGGVVTLTEDIVLTTPLEVYGEMTINLNGKTISSPSSYAIENYSKLTISGEGNMEGLGGIRSHSGSLTINGGNYTCSSNWSTGTYNHILKAVDTEVVINGGNFDATVGGTNNAMINVSENSIITINGGTFKNVNGVIPQFAPYMFTYEKNGKLIINGGDFYGGWRFNGETATTDIKGGTFAVSYDGQSFHAASTHVLTIYGGVFSLENGAKLNPAKHIAAGLKAVMIDGRYYVIADDITVAASPAEVKDVFKNGGSVILAEDIKFEKITSIEPGADVYLNLNGKTITVEENTTSNTLMYVKEGAKLTIDGNGTIDLGDVSTMAIFAPYGELVINNGTFIRNEVKTITKNTTGLFMGAKITSSNVTINGGYFDAGYYDANAADIEELLAGTKVLDETADDVAKRGNSKDANLVRTALKDNVSTLLNHSGYGSFKVYGGTFVGANPAWGDEGCMLPTTPNYLRPWSYYQGALLDGQTFNENGIVLPAGYTITNGTTENGIPTYTVTYNK